MTRIPLLDPDDAAVKRLLVGGTSTPLGVPNVLRALANSCEAIEATRALAAAGYRSDLVTPAERELAYLTASLVNNCHY